MYLLSNTCLHTLLGTVDNKNGLEFNNLYMYFVIYYLLLLLFIFVCKINLGRNYKL